MFKVKKSKVEKHTVSFRLSDEELQALKEIKEWRKSMDLKGATYSDCFKAMIWNYHSCIRRYMSQMACGVKPEMVRQQIRTKRKNTLKQHKEWTKK